MHKTKKEWLYPLIALAILTPFSYWLDYSIAHYFYTIGNDPVEHFVSNPFLNFLFVFGVYPANLIVVIAAFMVFFSYFSKKLKKFRNPFLVILLTYSLGAGLFINGILKEYWGRPRPKQVEAFGGLQAFRPYYSPHFNNPVPSKSFPCGHCASGFSFFSLVMIGRRLHMHRLTQVGWILALGLGITLSIARMAQGGHFLTDVLFSALIMWYAAIFFDWLVYAGEESH